MTWTDVFTGTGHFFQWTFKYMKALGNGPNLIFWLIIASMLVLWLFLQARYNKEAKANGTLK